MNWFRKRSTPSDSDAFGAVATDMLMNSFSPDTQRTLAGRNLDVTNGLLADYWDHDIDWKGLWALASNQDEATRPSNTLTILPGEYGLPHFGDDPHWLRLSKDGRNVPVTVLAFWGVPSRVRVAKDPTTDEELLQVLVNDPAGAVRLAARMHAASRGLPII